MLIVSDRALDVIAGAIDSDEVADDQALRLAKTAEGEFGLVVDQPQADDQIVTRDEKPVLYVANEVSTSLDGATLDIAEGTNPVRLTLKVPEPGPQGDGASAN
jgi:Fe-S cluster assembly iron-binding protein IscA